MADPERKINWHPLLAILGIVLAAVPYLSSYYEDQKQERLRREKMTDDAAQQLKERLINGTASDAEVLLSGQSLEKYEAYKRSLKTKKPDNQKKK